MKKILLILGITACALCAVVQFCLPPIAKTYVERHAKELTHRKMSIGSLSVNVFTGGVQIEDFTLFEEDDATPFVRFENLDVNVGMLSLLSQKTVIESVELSGAHVNVVQNGERFNFDDIMDFFASDNTTATDDDGDLAVVVNNIRLDRSFIMYKDVEVGSEWALRDVSLFVPGIDLSDMKADMGLDFTFKNGGSLTTKINYDDKNARYDLLVKIANFHLDPILPYLQQSLNVDSVRGEFSARLNIKGSTNHVLEFDANGDLSINDFALIDAKSNKIVAFENVTTSINKIDLIRNEFVFNSLRINNLQSYYEIYENNSDNFAELFKEEDTGADSTETPMSITIKDLLITDANVSYIDNTLPQAFTYNINHVTVSAANFNPDKKNNVTANASLQNSGTLKIRWIGNANDISNQNISIQLSNLDLKPFSPYSLAMFGFPIDDGLLSLQSHNLITNNMLDGENKISMYNPKFGNKDKSIKPEYSVPLKLGMYILTDKHGKVEMDLPISGDIESPDFSYRKIIFKALGNVLVKVATSPFTAMKSNNADIETITIPSPYSPVLTDEECAKFSQIASMMREKPMLKLVLTQEINYPATIEEYCSNELKKNVFLSNPNNLSEDVTSNELLLKQKYSAINIASAEVSRYADSAAKAQGTQTGKKFTNERKALLLYEKQQEEQLTNDANERNERVVAFLTQNNAIPDTSISIRLNLLKDFEKNEKPKTRKNFYRIEWEMDDEE